ncbi:MAG: ribulose-phosphate 3-epimerase [Muribaculaceae bacterium]|nr:ribulose-phosphate 3-epimerase [Muribaculaceae bacterium]
MIVAPSLLSADFFDLRSSVRMVESSSAQWLHCDVMDGVFVPNISFGFPVIEAISKHTSLPLDVHLMIVEPDKYISQVRDCGAAIMNVHYEACTHLHRTVQAIRNAGMRPAVTLNPATPVAMLCDIINDVDMVLLMSVNPGFGGQSFIPHTLTKIKQLKQLIVESGSEALIEVDGGVNLETAPLIAKAGADVLVAGNAVFKAESPISVIDRLVNL